MSELANAGRSSIVKLIESKVSDLDIKPEIKNLVIFLIENSDAYADFFIEYAKQSKGNIDPTKLLIALLAKKGKSLSDFGIKTIDNETMNNIWAVISLLWDIKGAAKYSAAGFVGPFITFAMIVASSSEFLCNFTPAQLWWYNHMIKESSSRYVPLVVKTTLRQSVQP
jgi:hypothetical protein